MEVIHVGWEERAIESCDKRGYDVTSFYYKGGLVYVYNRNAGCTYPLFESKVTEWIKNDEKQSYSQEKHTV